METFAAAVLTISAGIWIGAIVFQSAVVAALLGFGVFAGWTATVFVLIRLTGVMIFLEAISPAMVPQINSARDAGPAGEATFARLHRTSVFLTVAILLLGIAVLTIVAARAAAGI